MGEWLFMLIFLVGVIALVLEIFVTPGFGVSGLAGLLFIGLSIYLAANSGTQAIASLVIAIVITLIGLIIAIKVLTKRKAWKSLVLDQKLETQQGYVAAVGKLNECIGCIGIALTTLRPAGTALINGQRIDVVTDGNFIDKDCKVVVKVVQGSRVLVEKVEEL
jgi:membrane-bound ClpP family serine protease